MTQWYFVAPNSSDRVGPLNDAAARARAARHRDDQCWREGLSGWQSVRAIPEFSAPGDVVPPHMPPLSRSGGNRSRADEIDYRIVGNDMPFVEVELDPGETAIAEAGALMYKDASVQMDTVFGDGSHSGQGGGVMDKLFSAGKRVLTGESLFTTMFTHTGSGKAKVAFAAPYPGTVVAMKLSDHGGRLICQ